MQHISIQGRFSSICDLESDIEIQENDFRHYECPTFLMPKLSDIGNSDAVDSVYAARAVVYVEADVDSVVFARIVGMSDAQKVAFKAPRAHGGGYSAVCAQVGRERGNGNHRVFGLIDGEAAATLGSLCELIAATSAIFPLPNYDGVFCLAQHELENLMLLHGDICGFLVHGVDPVWWRHHPLGGRSQRCRRHVPRIRWSSAAR